MKDQFLELSQVPLDWEVIPCGFFFKEKSIKNTKNEVNLSVYRDYGVILRDSRDDNHNRISEDISNYKLVEEGDFVLNKMKCWMGSLGVSNYRGIVSPAYTVLEPKKEINKQYFHYLLRSEKYRQIYESLSYGVRVGQWELRYHDFKNIPALYPELREQKIISEYLDKKISQINRLVEKIEKKIDLLNEQKTSLINQYVTKGIDNNVEMKDSGIDWIGDIPKNWKLSKVKWITEKIGSGITPRGGSEIYTEEGIKLLRSQNIYFDGLHLENVVYISKEIDESMSNSRTKKNDVLFNITGGSIGRCCLINTDETMNVNQHVCIVRPETGKIDPYYLFSFLSSFIGQIQLRQNLTGSGREGLNFENLGNFLIPLPEFEEQKKIGNQILKINQNNFSILDKFKSKLSLLNEYRQSLISSVVTGKIRITEDMI